MKVNSEKLKKYSKGFKIDELFKESTGGIKTDFDIETFSHSKPEDQKYKYQYSAFDKRYPIYDGRQEDKPENELLKKIVNARSNVYLIASDQVSSPDFHHIFLSKLWVDIHFFSLLKRDTAFIFPLYNYTEGSTRTPNFKPEVVKQIAANLYLTFTPEKEAMQEGEVCFANSGNIRPEFRLTFAPMDLLDFIYAVLHSPAYIKEYNALLKTDFPRVPYPADSTNFWHLVNLGGQLRQIHLLESPALEKNIAKYPVEGDDLVIRIDFETYDYKPEVPDGNGEIHYPDYLGTIHINDTQYFAEIPTSAWEFYIGDYQPAQQWLKDRRGQILNSEDILHFQKIIHSLIETQRLMQEIDKILID